MLIKGLDECSICFEQIKNPSNGYKLNFSFGLVCDECNERFSSQEKEAITHAFNVAQGIFSTTKQERILVKDILFDVHSELYLQNERSITVQSIFEKILIRSQVYSLKLDALFFDNFRFSMNESKTSICAICNKIITSGFFSEDPRLRNKMICQKCNQKFSKEEIMTMISLFKKYGGFFNKLSSSKLTLKQILKNTLNTIRKENNFSKMIEINEKALHFALLFGYRHKAFIEELKKT